MDQEEALRNQLVKLLQGGQAYSPAQELLEGIKLEISGKEVPELPYTIWQLMEHLRIALWDILEFSRDPDYQSPSWPDGYWPNEKEPTDQAALDSCRKVIQQGQEEMIQLVEDKNNELFKPFPHGDGQNLLREVMLVAEHNAYHLGQIVIIRRLLGDWK